MARGIRYSWEEYEIAHQRIWGTPAPVKPPDKNQQEKQHKHNAKSTIIDGIKFPSKLEGQLYVELQWQFKAGLITEPLRQVPFALGVFQTVGVSKPSMRYYIADFVCIDLRSHCLMIWEAKGQVLESYRLKKKRFEEVYRIRITEYKKKS